MSFYGNLNIFFFLDSQIIQGNKSMRRREQPPDSLFDGPTHSFLVGDSLFQRSDVFTSVL